MQAITQVAPLSAQSVDNHLHIGGVSCAQLVAQYGTPLYVMDEGEIVSNLCEYKSTLDAAASQNGLAQSQIAYAAKAFLCKAMIELVQAEGCWLDCLAGGEFDYAVQMGFDPSNIVLHGNNKSKVELHTALRAGVGLVVVDNVDELGLIQQIIAEDSSVLSIYDNNRVPILLRVTPGVDAHTHEYISTGIEDTKFGLNIANGAALKAVELALQIDSVELRGLHCHIGSQIFNLDAYVEAIEIVLDFAEQVRTTLNHTFSVFDLGGGLGIAYTAEDASPSIIDYVQQVCSVLVAKCKEINYPQPSIILEPGRSIVGRAGITLYTVGAIKDTPNVRTYLFVDGGMSDNIRPALYQARYTTALANKMGSDPNRAIYAVAGKHCESGDIIAYDQSLSAAEQGDILAVFDTGAYNYAMASNYNGQSKPAVVFVKDGTSRLVVKRQPIQQLWQNDV